MKYSASLMVIFYFLGISQNSTMDVLRKKFPLPSPVSGLSINLKRPSLFCERMKAGPVLPVSGLIRTVGNLKVLIPSAS